MSTFPRRDIRRTSAALVACVGLAAVSVAFAAPASADPDGSVVFAPPADYPAATGTPGGSAAPIAHADFNRDGLPDLVAANTVGTGPVVLLGVGKGRFGAAKPITAGSDASVVGTGDFNSDGNPDIAAGSYLAQRMTILLGDGRGEFRKAGTSPLGGIPTQFAIADFNGDDHQDVVSSMYLGGKLTLLIGNGDGTFKARKSIPGPIISLAVMAVDLDDNGTSDIVVAETLPHRKIRSALPGELNVMTGNGDGTFGAMQTYPVGLMPEDLAAGDVDEDGNLDIIVANALTNDVSLMRGIGDGRLHEEERIGAGPKGVISSPLGELEGAPGVRLADFDGDEHLDLAVIQTVRNKVAVSRGDGNGNFKLSGVYPAPHFPEAFLAIDVDNDACTDLVIPGNMPPPLATTAIGKTRVSVLINESC